MRIIYMVAVVVALVGCGDDGADWTCDLCDGRADCVQVTESCGYIEAGAGAYLPRVLAPVDADECNAVADESTWLDSAADARAYCVTIQ